MKKSLKTKTYNLYKLLFLFIVFLGIGYAFLESNLSVNGDVTVEAPELNVYVQSTSVTSGSTSGTPTIIGNDKKEVDFTTSLTSDGSSFFEETTTVVNKGFIRPYLLGVDVKVYDSSNNEVTLAAPYEYSVTKGDGTPIQIGEQIGIGNTESFKFKFNYISGTDMSTVTDYPSYTFKIIYNYVKNPIILPSGKTKDNLEVGDEICILDQCFNFIKYDGTNNEDVVMLSKWNLNVGSNAKDTATNKQDSDVKGSTSSGTTYGNVAFSATNYWDDNGSPKSDYPGVYYPGPNYPTIYDATNYKTEPDFIATCDNSTNCYYTPGYSVAYYVEAYKDILSSYGTTIKDARLLTYAEAIDSSIGCSQDSGSCPIDRFITNTSFWLGSAFNNNRVWRVDSGGILYYNLFGNVNAFGVRPVVVISKENI